MAPVGMVSALGWLSSPEVGIISLIVFLILSVTLLTLCARCQRNTGNAYDVNAGMTTNGGGGPNGTAGTKTGGGADPGVTSPWRDHRSMPPSTLDRPKALTT
ncbi:hypothetical protein VZT92_010552 [Zoarces viviparus]|uniref:Uncharacterized protein n=1 Tax=Zoarces viviparus TaxID=48416 RepID=A0AAW1F9Q4_ZOAVI